MAPLFLAYNSAVTTTERQYFLGGARKCIWCDSENLKRSPPKLDGAYDVRRRVKCMDCNSSWIDVFRLVSIRGFEKGEEA